jgi:hypothetical protein
MKKIDKDFALKVIGGSHLIGTISTTYRDLVEVFGLPTFEEPSGDDKVQKEWVFEFEGKYFTIYDWKTYDEEFTINELDRWNVGGKEYDLDFILNLEQKLER